ncbi:trypsin [Anopheles sinensis]|uniref:trypsin n=1 Tax=Anopheles sinensis TaxID=74873 RepID=A0A084VY28_ANOSI|nr:trypsin [Anopheles sinensis]
MLFPISFILVALSTAASAKSGIGKVNYIVGGQKIPVTNAPYQAALFRKYEFSCGGAVVAPIWILTAGHCVTTLAGELFPPLDLFVRVGADDANVNGDQPDQPVDTVFLHPFYAREGVGLDYDTALLRLTGRLQFSDQVRCIPIAPPGTPATAGTVAIVTGYGQSIPNSVEPPSSTELKALEVTIYDHVDCQHRYAALGKEITDRMFCAGAPGQGTCHYDSGGPAVQSGQLLGITMWKPIVCIALVLTCCALEINGKRNRFNRIVGGDLISITEAPYQAAILINLRFLCGGVVLAPSWVLTTALCMVYPPGGYLAPGVVQVRLGTEDGNIAWGPNDKPVVAVVPHPNFNKATKNFNVALLKMKQNIAYETRIKCIKLVDANAPLPVDQQVEVTGYGSTDPEKPALDAKLRSVDVTIVDPDLCYLKYQADEEITITRNMFCAAGLGRDACQYDAGGPAVYQDRLVGLISHGAGCASMDFPGIYTRISAVRGWIDAVIKKNTRKESNGKCIFDN